MLSIELEKCTEAERNVIYYIFKLYKIFFINFQLYYHILGFSSDYNYPIPTFINPTLTITYSLFILTFSDLI